jgi:hypothetical protein
MKTRVVVAAALVAAAPLVVSTANAQAATTYTNCTVLNKHYRHGVGLPNAHDHVSGSTRPVTTFYRSKALYNANKSKDRDRDGIACEKL